jgi:hypothetical protein
LVSIDVVPRKASALRKIDRERFAFIMIEFSGDRWGISLLCHRTRTRMP